MFFLNCQFRFYAHFHKPLKTQNPRNPKPAVQAAIAVVFSQQSRTRCSSLKYLIIWLWQVMWQVWQWSFDNFDKCHVKEWITNGRQMVNRWQLWGIGSANDVLPSRAWTPRMLPRQRQGATKGSCLRSSWQCQDSSEHMSSLVFYPCLSMTSNIQPMQLSTPSLRHCMREPTPGMVFKGI